MTNIPQARSTSNHIAYMQYICAFLNILPPLYRAALGHACSCWLLLQESKNLLAACCQGDKVPNGNRPADIYELRSEVTP